MHVTVETRDTRIERTNPFSGVTMVYNSDTLGGLQQTISSLENSDEHLEHVALGREQARVLLLHCRFLLSQMQTAIAPHSEANLHDATNLCERLTAYLEFLSRKSLVWCLLRRDMVYTALLESKMTLTSALRRYKLEIETLDTEFTRACREDANRLKSHLKGLADGDSLLDSLQTGGNNIKELATALTQYVRRLQPVSMDDAESAEVDDFLRAAATTAQQLIDRSPDYEIPSWCVTSFEVSFDTDSSRLIGRGAFGRILEGEWNGKLVAVKQMGSRVATPAAIESIRHEVQIWSQLSHANILQFYGACLEASHPFIISKLCSSGNALQFLRTHPHFDRIRMLHDVSVGMLYLHAQGIIHADLKASNILIGDSDEALIADFGLSQEVSSSFNVTRISSERVGGTFHWMAPEVLQGKGLNKPADMYGFALIAWELYTRGAIPFESVTDAKLFCSLVTQGERPPRPTEVDADIWILMQSCWGSDPYARPDFASVEKTLASLINRPDHERTCHFADDSTVSRAAIFRRSEDKPGPTADLPDQPRQSILTVRKNRRSTISETGPRPSFFGGFINKKILAFSKSQDSANVHHKSHLERHSDELLVSAALGIASLFSFLVKSPALPSTDAVLAHLFNLSLKPEGVASIIVEESLVPTIVTRLLRPTLPENEKYLISGLLANLACHRAARTQLLSQPDLVSALMLSMDPTKSPSVRENATRCLYNLSTTNESHSLISGHEGGISVLGRLLSGSPSPGASRNVLGCLTNLSHKEPGRSAVLATSEAIDSLLKILQLVVEDTAKEQALMCLGNLSVDERGVIALLKYPDIISGLSECLKHSSTSPIKLQALRCFRNISKSIRSHDDILSCEDVMRTVSEILSIRVNSNQQKYALHFLHRMTSSGVGRAWLRKNMQTFGNLHWFVDNGSSEEQARAKDCLGVMEGLL